MPMSTPMSNATRQCFAEALRRLASGELEPAERAARAAVAEAPHWVQAVGLLGRILMRRGDAQAEKVLREALRLDPGFLPSRQDLAALLHGQGRLDELCEQLEHLATLQPQRAELFADLGLAQLARGELGAARDALQQAAALNPALAPAWLGLAQAQEQLGERAAALEAIGHALRADPEHLPAVLFWILLALREGREQAALNACRRVLERHPGLTEAREYEAMALRGLGRSDEAAQRFEALARALPGRVDLWAQLGAVRLNLGDTEGARAAFESGLAAQPDNHALLWARMQCLPRLYRDQAQMHEALAAWRADLEAFHDAIDATPPSPRTALDCLLAPTPFYRHYIPEDPLTDQRRLGAALRKLAARVPAPQLEARPLGARLRIGFASPALRAHTVYRLFGGLLHDLDRQRFEVHALLLDDAEDAITAALRAAVDGFHRIAALPRALQQIAELELDALVYLDIGMHSMPQALSVFRLAPLQAMLWGHPITSGLPTIDMFISSALMESPGSEAQYSERLVCLPQHGLYCQPPTEVASGFRPRHAGSELHLVCAQNAVKLLPAHLELFARIAAELPQARLTLMPNAAEGLRERLTARIAEVFGAHGLDADQRVEILPQLPFADFLAVLGSADLALDTPDWSGGQTALDTLWMDTPILTPGGTTLRSRHSQALLERIGLAELVAGPGEAYVAKVVELGRDHGALKALRRTIAERKRLLYGDRSVLNAFEDILEQAVRETRAAAH